MSKKCAGLIYGNLAHHLDHIAPLCVLLRIPMIVTDDAIGKTAKQFYPGVECIITDPFSAPELVVTHFDVIFCSMPRDLFDEAFFFAQKMSQKKIFTIWCPHGNSDKGQRSFFMEALRKEERALVYGKQMIDFLKSKHAFDQLKAHAVTGNYRYAFYLREKEFYDHLAQREIARRLPPASRTILYAPTWQDYEASGSFFDAMPSLGSRLPPQTNLIVKLHPNLLEQNNLQVEEIIDGFRSSPHILFLTDFPPIYPLLNLADVYLGDMSSIGYDFLALDRPLFFLNQNARDPAIDPGLYLFRCGIAIKKENYEAIYETINNFFHFELRSFSPIRKEVYAYAFGTHAKPLDQLKNEIEQMVSELESDLSFF